MYWEKYALIWCNALIMSIAFRELAASVDRPRAEAAVQARTGQRLG